MKKCCTCKTRKNENEFHKNKNTKDGLKSECKVCSIKRTKKWRELNPEREKETVKRWKENNLNRYKETHKKYSENHPNIYKEWYKNNSEKERERIKKWNKEHPDKAKAKHHRYIARKSGNGGSFTSDEWNELCKKYNYCCVRCGKQKPLTIDHVVPIKLGGTSYINNIQPLCLSCNSSKGAKYEDYR